MLKMTVVGMKTQQPVKEVDSVLQDLVPAVGHLVVDYQMEMTMALVVEEVVVAGGGVDSVTLMETTIPFRHEVAVAAGEDLAEATQKTMRAVALVILGVALAVDSNLPMKMEMMRITAVEASEVEEVDLGTKEVDL